MAVIIPLLLLQSPPPQTPDKQTQEDPAPRLDLHGDPLPERALARMGTVRFRPEPYLDFIVYSPDGRALATGNGSIDHIQLWDVTTGKVVASLACPYVNALAFHPDGKSLFGFDNDNTIHRWHLESKTHQRKWCDPLFYCMYAVFSPDLERLAIAGYDDTSEEEEPAIVLLDVETGLQVHEPNRLQAEITSLCFSPDGKLLVSGGEDRTIRVWDVETGEELRRVPHHIPPGEDPLELDDTLLVEVAGGGPEGWTLVSICPDDREDTRIHLWDAASGAELRELRLPTHKDGKKTGTPNLLCVSPDGERISAFDDHRLFSWMVDSGKLIFQREVGWVRDATYSPDGRTLAFASGWTFQFLDADTGTRRTAIEAHDESVRHVLFSHDGARLLSSARSCIRIWDTTTGRPLRKLDIPHGAPRNNQLAGDGRCLVFMDGETTRVWDLSTQKAVVAADGTPYSIRFNETYERHPRPLEAAIADPNPTRLTTHALSSDGRLFGYGRVDGRVRIHRLPGGGLLREIPAHARPVTCLAFSNDGRTLHTTGLDGALRSWNTETGDRLREMTLEGLDQSVFVDFCCCRRRVALGEWNGRLHVWDTSPAVRLLDVQAHRSSFIQLRFSPDGARLLTQGTRGNRGGDIREILEAVQRFVDEGRVMPKDETRVHVWDSKRGGPLFLDDEARGEYEITSARELVSALRRLLGMRTWPEVPSFSPDGALLAVARGDYVYVYESASGLRILLFEGHRDDVNDLAFSPDGSILASASEDTTVLVWDLVPRAIDEAGGEKDAGKHSTEELWKTLAGENAGAAYSAIWRLACRGDNAVAFLEEHLSPIPPGVPEEIRRLIGDLDDDAYEVREEASIRLSKLADEAGPALREALAGTTSAEVRRRLRPLLDGKNPPYDRFPNETLRGVRAVQVLYRIGSPRARALLRSLAEGSPYALQTREAKTALARREAQSKSE